MEQEGAGSQEVRDLEEGLSLAVKTKGEAQRVSRLRLLRCEKGGGPGS